MHAIVHRRIHGVPVESRRMKSPFNHLVQGCLPYNPLRVDDKGDPGNGCNTHHTTSDLVQLCRLLLRITEDRELQSPTIRILTYASWHIGWTYAQLVILNKLLLFRDGIWAYTDNLNFLCTESDVL